MYNNRGYIGNSRSVRSSSAIEDFEVPLALINKGLVNKFISQLDGLTKEERIKLNNVKVFEWKYIGKYLTRHSSWHHTGKYFNKTYHYSLYEISEYILENDIEVIKDSYKKFKQLKEKEKAEIKLNYKIAYVKVQEWGGTRNYPKLIGYTEEIGIVVGDWFYYLTGCFRKISKYKTYGKKVESLEEFQDYKSLIKKHPSFKNNKKNINYLIKEKCN